MDWRNVGNALSLLAPMGWLLFQERKMLAGP